MCICMYAYMYACICMDLCIFVWMYGCMDVWMGISYNLHQLMNMYLCSVLADLQAYLPASSASLAAPASPLLAARSNALLKSTATSSVCSREADVESAFILNTVYGMYQW